MKRSRRKVSSPVDLSAEESLLSALLQGQGAIDDVVEIISPEDFHDDKHQAIFQACLDLHIAGKEINQVSVADQLRQNGNIVDTSFLAYLALSKSTNQIKDTAGIIHRLSMMRQIKVALSEIEGLCSSGSLEVSEVLDELEERIRELREKTTENSRRVVITNPRIITTNPPRYKFCINGKDVNLTPAQISNWRNFKAKVIEVLNFVPLQPRDWDSMMDKLLRSAVREEAPRDASAEYQILIEIGRWFERMSEATEAVDLAAGHHVVRTYKGQDYYFFQSTPLLQFLKAQGKTISSEDLWVLIKDHGGIKDKPIRLGKTTRKLWGIPTDFLEDVEEIEMPEDF